MDGVTSFFLYVYSGKSPGKNGGGRSVGLSPTPTIHESGALIRVKRVYNPPSPDDGYRVLIDRIWPRGLSKEDARLDEWLRELAVSDELRRWFGHDPGKWSEFRAKYRKELDAHREELRDLLRRTRGKNLTILYAAKDEEHNNAVVLKEYLEKLE